MAQRAQGRRRRVMTVAVALAAIVVAVACQPPPVPTPSPGCTLDPTAGVETRTVDGRDFHLLVPPGMEDRLAQGVPLLIALHGLNVEWNTIYGYTDFDTMAASEEFIVAYPEATNLRWAAGEDSADVTWLRHVVDEIESQYCVNPARVHAVGHSMGAYMAQRLACDADDLFASVAEYAGGSPTLFAIWGECVPSRPISVIMAHGDADGIVAIQLGRGSRGEWVARNGCDTAPTATASEPDGFLNLYANCDDGVAVTWREFPGQDHLWPDTSTLDTEMWTFLSAYPHPTRLTAG